MRQLHQRCLMTGLLALSILPFPGLTAQAQVSEDSGQIQRYERKYISFFYPQDYAVNQALARAFQLGFPRFDYHLAGTSVDMDFSSFIQQTRDYIGEVAGDIAAGREVADPRFGDKVVSWSETQKIANAAWVFVPHWEFGEISIDGPYPSNSKNPLSGDWQFHAETDVDLEMELWNLTGDTPKRYRTIEDDWSITRKNVYRVSASEVADAAARYNEGRSESDKINLESGLSSSDREILLAQLRRDSNINRNLRQIENLDAVNYMMRTAAESIGYNSVIASVRGLSEFLIRAEVSEPDMKRDRVGISLGEGETPTSLGIDLDSSYKIIEYIDDGQSREVGYVKVRELGMDSLISQPIIVGRDFELGDQVVEYPKAGFGVNLRAGGLYVPQIGSGVAGSSGISVGGGLDIDGNIGPWFGASELYLGLGGSIGTDSVGVGELYLQKKWFFRQLILALGVRGGGAIGPLNSQDVVFGGTGLLGVHWQASPDFAFGVDGGWRQYGPYSGPVVSAFIRWDG